MNFKVMSVSNRQRGAVLIFSLVMLLLLTLASVSMIQQNKQELAMTGNTLDQTVALARAETDLVLAEQAIDDLRLFNAADPNDRRCNIGSIINQNDIVLTTATGQATVTAVNCIRQITSGPPPVYEESTRCPFVDGDYDTTGGCAQCSSGGTEIYAIRWTSTVGSNYGAQRTVESNYAVDCSVGLF